MKKTFQKLTVLLLALTMVLSMSVAAFAETTDPNPAGKNGISNFTTTPAEGEANAFPADTKSIFIVKDYKRGENTQGNSSSPAENFEFTITPYYVWNSTETDAPLLGVTYVPATETVEAKGNQNVVRDDENNKTIVTVKVDSNKAGEGESAGKTEVSLPTYPAVGDYWYLVTETNNKTTGVTYHTNDEDGNYYIHVQVVKNNEYKNPTDTPDEPKFLHSVTLHKTALDTNKTNAEYNDAVSTDGLYDSSSKVNAVENQYSAGELVIKKEVTGNAGDENQLFEVTVTFTKPEGSIINSKIIVDGDVAGKDYSEENHSKVEFIAGQNDVTKAEGQETTYNNTWLDSMGKNVDADSTEELTNTVKVLVKNGSKVTFSNIPYGVTYTIQEELPKNDTYKQMIAKTTENPATGDVTTFNGAPITADSAIVTTLTERPTTDANVKLAEGAVTDAKDEYTITNHKETAIDVGVILESAPFVAILVIAASGAVVIFARRRKNMIEE